MAISRGIVLGISLLAVAVSSASAARAQPAAASDVYDDVKGVIEELLVDEVTQTVVPNAACQAPFLLKYFPNSLQLVYERQFGSVPPVLQQETATAAGSYVYYAAINGNVNLGTFLRNESPSEPDGTVKECVAAIQAAQGPANLAGCDFMPPAASPAPPGGSPPPPAPYCPGNADPPPEKPAPLLDTACASPTGAKPTIACETGFAIRDFILGQTDLGQNDLRQIIAAVLADAWGIPIPSAELIQINTLLAGYIASATYTPPPTCPAASPPPGCTLADVAAHLGDIQQVAAAWRLLAGSKGISPLDLTTKLVSTLTPVLDNACTGRPTCKAIRSNLRAASDVLAAFKAASNHDVRGAAVALIHAALVPEQSQACGVGYPANRADADKSSYSSMAQSRAVSCSQQKSLEIYASFLGTLASYTLEASGGDLTTATREAFKAAAFDLLRTEGPRSGFNRPPLTNVGSYLLPRPSLRLSMNTGYINGPSHDGFRYLASVEWPNVRVTLKHSQPVYVGLHFAVGDALGPFSEAALRDQTVTASKSSLVFANFLTPRVDLLFGSPILSSHLAISLGASYRSAIAVRDPSGAASLTYYSWLQGTPDAFQGRESDFYLRFLEGNVGVTYVP